MVRGGIDVGQKEGIVGGGRGEANGESKGTHRWWPSRENHRVPSGDQATAGTVSRDSDEIVEGGGEESFAFRRG